MRRYPSNWLKRTIRTSAETAYAYIAFIRQRVTTEVTISAWAAILLMCVGCTATGQEAPRPPVEAILHRTGTEPDGRFAYWVELPGVQPMDHDIQGGLWAEESGTFVLRLDPGVKLLRVQAFAATDIGKVFEGDLNLTTPQGRGLALFAPHKEQPFQNVDGWLGERRPDYTVPVDDTALYLRWVCRVTGPAFDPLYRTPTGRVETRCHFGLSIDAQQQ
jgi:hypothetical protein